MPTFTDLFGEGAVYSGGTLTIPRANLPGLSGATTNKISAIVALFILFYSYFEGELVDWDGETIIDDGGTTLGYSQNRAEATLTAEFVVKNMSLVEPKMFWDYLVATYTEQDPDF